MGNPGSAPADTHTHTHTHTQIPHTVADPGRVDKDFTVFLDPPLDRQINS